MAPGIDGFQKGIKYIHGEESDQRLLARMTGQGLCVQRQYISECQPFRGQQWGTVTAAFLPCLWAFHWGIQLATVGFRRAFGLIQQSSAS